MEASIGIGIGIVISVAIICITFLMYTGKLGTFSWSKANGVSLEADDNGNVSALMFLEKMLDTAEGNFKRNMLRIHCFNNNPTGLKHAAYIIALNHCLRDLSSIGYSNYESRNQRIGHWTDAEAECFMHTLLTSGRQLVDERLEAYNKCRELKSSRTFRQILDSKIQKNMHYSTIIDDYREEQGIKSAVHSSIMNKLKREQFAE